MKVRPKYNFVDSKLARGCYVYSPIKLLQMKNNGINQVIDLRKDTNCAQKLEKFFCKLIGLNYINCPLSFRDKNFVGKDFFLNINKLIAENIGKTYIHCKKGKHRTGLCVAAYEKEVLKKNDNEVLQSILSSGFDELITNPSRKSLANAITNFSKIFDLNWKKTITA